MNQEHTDQDTNRQPQRSGGDTYSYRGWMMSDNFFKRAFAVWGHYFVANLVIFFVILLLFVIFLLPFRESGVEMMQPNIEQVD